MDSSRIYTCQNALITIFNKLTNFKQLNINIKYNASRMYIASTLQKNYMHNLLRKSTYSIYTLCHLKHLARVSTLKSQTVRACPNILSTNLNFALKQGASWGGQWVEPLPQCSPRATVDNPPARVISAPGGLAQPFLLSDWETSAAVYVTIIT